MLIRTKTRLGNLTRSLRLEEQANAGIKPEVFHLFHGKRARTHTGAFTIASTDNVP